MEPTTSKPYHNFFSTDDDTELEIGEKSKQPEPSEKVEDVEKKNPDPIEAPKKKSEDDKLTERASQKDWITIVVTTSAVAMGILGVLAVSYLLASIFTGGLTLLGIIVPLSLAVVGFAGSVLTLTLLNKITNVLDVALTKLIASFKKAPPVPEENQVPVK